MVARWLVEPVPRRLLPRQLRAAAIGVALAASAVTAILGAHFANVSLAGPIDRALDGRLVDRLAGHQQLVDRLASLGNSQVIIVVTLMMVIALLVLHRPRGALLAALAPAVAGGVTEFLLKPLVGRTYKGELAFPSGHTAGVFAVAFVVIMLVFDPKPPRLPVAVQFALSFVMLALATGVAAALIAARYHYATDTVGGACVALAAVLSLSVAADAVADALTSPED